MQTSIVLTIWLVVCCGFAAAETYSGKCGDKINWFFDDNTGEMTLSGEGRMYDYDFIPVRTYDKFAGQVKSLTINEGIETLGTNAFTWFENMTSVSFPQTTLVTIGSNSFRGCSALNSVSIPDSVKVLKDYVFYECYGLTSVTLPNSIEIIPYAGFSSCYSLTSITIPETVKLIDVCAFDGDTSLESITIPDSVTMIHNIGFGGCESLKKVKLGKGLNTIGESAFEGCSSLETIKIPKNVLEIGKSAFASCGSLKSIQVDRNNAHYKSIDGVLYNKEGNTLITYPAGSPSTSFDIPNYTKTIGESAFEGCTKLESVTFPDSVVVVNDYVFEGCTALKTVKNYKLGYIPSGLFSMCTGLTEFTIPASVTRIQGVAFYMCKNLAKVTYLGLKEPDHDMYVFQMCDKLKTVYVPTAYKDDSFCDMPITKM